MDTIDRRETEALERIYRRASAELAALLETTDFQRGKAARLLAQIDAISRRLGLDSDAWVSRQVREAYLDGARRADLQLRRIGAAVEGLPLEADAADWLRVNEGAVRVAARQIARDLAGANGKLADSGRRIVRATAQTVISDAAVTETIARGLVAGGSKNRIARALRDRLAEGGRELLESGKMTPAELEAIADFQAGYIQAGRARLPIGYYCRMVASHQLRTVVVAAEKERLVEQGRELGDELAFDLVMVTGPISGDFCDLYVNKVFSVSGRHPDYPALSRLPSGGPPFHPNCTHTIAPFVPDLATGREVERARLNERFLDLDNQAAQKAYGGTDRMYAARRTVTTDGTRSSRPQG